ncbi:plasmid mobilization protein [Scatolibacter rhodanostii]|uniref:plasmid mobilization protein n=1 Tax=Scatolibacter rhodanostii TaxID=2014781 RepID=UPI001180C9A7|nr:plasmid mobilization relaxosome protein MobC [Scatolibacter rhodanostii]
MQVRKNRTREIEKKVFLSAEENRIMKSNMQKVGVRNFSLYARKMLCNGYLIVRNFDYLKQTARELGRIAQNLNMIAKRANTTQSIYEDDVKDIAESYKKAKAQIASVISDLVNEEKFYKTKGEKEDESF